MGDIVATEPVIRHLRREMPSAFLVWVVGARYQELLAHHPDLDAVLPVQCLSEWIALRQPGVFDQIIDLHFDGRGCARCGSALTKPDGGHGVTSDNYYATGSLLQAFCRGAALPELTDAPHVHIPASVRAMVDHLALPPLFVAIHARSSETVRDWRDDRWKDLAATLMASGMPVVEVGLHSVIRSRDSQYTDLCGRISMLQTAEVIARARAFVGVDSGPAHIANAVNTFGVIILGAYGPFSSYVPYSGGYGTGMNGVLLHAHGSADTTEVGTVLDALAKPLARYAETAPAI